MIKSNTVKRTSTFCKRLKERGCMLKNLSLRKRRSPGSGYAENNVGIYVVSRYEIGY
jgi:hypothetical protein